MLVLLAMPVGASARVRKFAPPGNSAISQYVESVPTAGGGRPTATIHHGGTGWSGNLTEATQRAFSRQGTDARAAAALAGATAPARGEGTQHQSGGSSPAAGFTSTSPLDSLLKAATGSSSSGGIGLWLPAVLIVVLLGGAALALRRGLARRST